MKNRKNNFPKKNFSIKFHYNKFIIFAKSKFIYSRVRSKERKRIRSFLVKI